MMFWCKRFLKGKEMVDTMTVEVESLKGTMEELEQKAFDMDPEITEGFMEVD